MPRGTLLALLLAPVAAVTATAQSQTVAGVADRPGVVGREVAHTGRAAAPCPIWTLDPIIRDFVGPAEYAWDFNAPDGGAPGAVSAAAASGQGEGSAMRVARAFSDPEPAARR